MPSALPEPATLAELADLYFWPHFDRSGGVDACWPWARSCVTTTGYGQINNKAFGGRWSTHVLAFVLTYGPVPDGHFVDHTCHNDDLTCGGGITCCHRPCGNPRHLRPATNRENLDAANRARKRSQFKEACPHGHAYDEENTARHSKTQHRYCKRCNREKVWCRRWNVPWPATSDELAAAGYVARR
jgi:hypothetical protein